MQLKAGTYRFNKQLTVLQTVTNPSINYSITVDGETVEFTRMELLYMAEDESWVFILKYTDVAVYCDYSSDLTEDEVGGERGWATVLIDTEGNVLPHTITEDTEVNDTFGTWYIDNTDYSTVNGSGESVLGLRRFVDNPDIASLSDIVPAETLESDLTDFYMEYTCNGVTYNLLIGQINEGAAGGYGLLYFNDEDVEICNPYLTTDGWNAEYGDEVRNINITKAPQSTELYAWLLANTEAVEETPEQPETPTKKFTRLYLGEVAYSSNGKRFRKLQTEEYVEPTLEAGLYDADDNLIASWDTLVNTYGMDCEKDYTAASYNDTTSLFYIVANNNELANGVKLVIGDNVTRIGCYAFRSCWFLSFVEILPSVTAIGENAFLNCREIITITIPESVTSIESSAFSNCAKLIEVCNKSSLDIKIGSSGNGGVAYYANHIITDKSQSYLKYIDYFVFYDDGTDVKLLKYYGSNKNVTLPVYENNKEYAINYRAFYCADNKKDGYPDRYESIRSITIPDCVTSIGGGAFAWCEALTSVNFSENSRLKEIGGEAFFRTHISSINFPNSLETIKQGAFKTCTSLSSITIPESVTTIGTVTFENCSSLRTAVIRSSYGLSNRMFDSCSSLRSVTIGSSVKYIGSYVFEDCYNIANINYEGTVEQWNAIEKNSKWQGYWDTHPVTYVQCTDGTVAI